MASLPYPRTHRAFCWYILPRNTLSCCKISHRFHRFLGCFQGVHLSQVHQQSKKCTNREGVPSARLVQLRQLHPLGVLPQNSQNTLGFQLRKSPTEFTEHTETSCWEKLPQISQIYTDTFSKKVLCVLWILWENNAISICADLWNLWEFLCSNV